MALVEFSRTAVTHLDHLIDSRSLPGDTRSRVVGASRHLEHFPESGAVLEGKLARYRFVLGPWSWMLIIYEYFADDDLVVITGIEDSREADAATADR